MKFQPFLPRMLFWTIKLCLASSFKNCLKFFYTNNSVLKVGEAFLSQRKTFEIVLHSWIYCGQHVDGLVLNQMSLSVFPISVWLMCYTDFSLRNINFTINAEDFWNLQAAQITNNYLCIFICTLLFSKWIGDFRQLNC